ncbi:hypothetical protein A0O28_0014380 [Trichoderma guizhouense]|uniref:DUF7924 domain-containing protein n=1 Tax=Trichoderma guizhouense TaxID=1491466 RepID=A0A1T3CB35_9HYPO|nr:hypothetical protein A0O28_0014380 [Trichoderma guizhouense]
MESTQLQQQEPQQGQRLASPSRQPSLSPAEEEAVAGLARMNKRIRENPIIADDEPIEERGVKRRQTLDSRDGAEAATETVVEAPVEAPVETSVIESIEATIEDEPSGTTLERASSESSEQIEGLTNEETTRAILTAANDLERARRRRVLAAYIEQNNTRETSYDGASTWNSSLREPSARGASNGNPSTRQTSLQPEEDNGETDSQEDTEFDPSSWRPMTRVESPDRPLYLYPVSEADSECYALPKSMWPVEHKTDPFRDPSWEHEFQRFGTFLHEHPLGLCQESEALCKKLLEDEQPLPEKSLFDDDIIRATCEMIQHRNETMVFRDITPLIAPSAELLALRGETHKDLMYESTNEIWAHSQPILRVQPQPTYAVGFRGPAFTTERYQKIYTLFEDRCTDESSPVASTPFMFFPFFSCEIGSLSMARRQNTHSMSIGMNGVVELFRGVNREAELDRQVLAFSIAHSDHEVQIVAHYPVILGEYTSYFQKVLYSFDFADPACVDKWAAYRFTRNLYDHWMPIHYRRVCSAIDDISHTVTDEM